MNLYKLNSKELLKLQSDFNKTAYGRRLVIFSNIPFIFGFIIMIGAMILGIVADLIPNEEFEMTNIYITGFLIFSISFLTFLIMQLFYQQELRKYCENQEN